MTSVEQATQRTFLQALAEWEKADRELDLLKAKEMELRLEVAQLGFKFDKDTERKGTEYTDLGNGWRAKAVFKMNAKVSTDNVNEVLEELEKTGSEGTFVAERIIKFDPKLSISEYDKLSPAYKKIIDKCVTFSVGTPTLEIVEPKVKK